METDKRAERIVGLLFFIGGLVGFILALEWIGPFSWALAGKFVLAYLAFGASLAGLKAVLKK